MIPVTFSYTQYDPSHSQDDPTMIPPWSQVFPFTRLCPPDFFCSPPVRVGGGGRVLVPPCLQHIQR